MDPEAHPRRRLPTQATMQEDILDHLRRGPDSISGVARRLAAERPHPPHRLTVAGYLEALADLGVLHPYERPPSRLYRLANPTLHTSLHERLGRILQESSHPPGDRVCLLVAALVHALGRPVFRAEVRLCGLLPAPTHGLETVVLDETQRRALRALFRRRTPRIEIPRGDPLLSVAEPEKWQRGADALLTQALLEATGAAHLRLSARDPGRQAGLLPAEPHP